MQVLGATIFAENTASGTTYGLFGSNANLELRDAVVNAVASSGAAVGASHWHNDVGQSANITIADVELRAESSAGAAFGLDIANSGAVGVKATGASDVAFTDVTTYAEAESWVWGADLVGSDTRLVRVDTRAVSTVSGFAYGVRCWGESSTIHDSLFRGDSAASSSFGIHVTDCDSELTGSEFTAAGSSTNIGLWGESPSGQSNTIEVRDSLLSGSTNSVRSLGAGAVSVEVVMSQLDGGAGFSASATDAQTCTAVTHNSAGSEMFQSGTSDPCP
jgi:hypothetical protein